jgi:hypothetical protein
MAIMNFKVACHIDEIGNKFYYLDDGQPFDRRNCFYHREDGPSIEYANGDKYWHFNNELHRLDGPAIEYSDNDAKLWYINGRMIPVKNNKEFLRLVKLKAFI